MELVKKSQDIKENIKTLEKYLQDENMRESAVGLIKRGTCFVAVKKDRGYSFYPSRYIGYKNNNYNAHINNDMKDGRNTNPAISEILGRKPMPSGDLEKEYRKYCDELGFTANNKGAFGVERKYWVL